MNYDGTFGCVIKMSLFILSAAIAAHATGNPVQPVLSLTQKERPALLETLKALTAIESGSREPDRIANVLAAKLRAIGGKVELIEPVEANAHRLSDTPYWRILQAASPTLRTHRSRQTHR
jgi:glutamate carboxypeptidase